MISSATSWLLLGSVERATGVEIRRDGAAMFKAICLMPARLHSWKSRKETASVPPIHTAERFLDAAKARDDRCRDARKARRGRSDLHDGKYARWCQRESPPLAMDHGPRRFGL